MKQQIFGAVSNAKILPNSMRELRLISVLFWENRVIQKVQLLPTEILSVKIHPKCMRKLNLISVLLW